MMGVSDNGGPRSLPETGDGNRLDGSSTHVATLRRGVEVVGPSRDHHESVHRNVICCLLALEIADYSAKPVFEQIRSTQNLRRLISDTTAHATSDDLVLVQREDGALLSFLADPEDCFTVALRIRQATSTQGRYRDLPLRIGINLGKAQIAEDEFGNPYLSGEGRQDADRLMRQGPPRQISVARQFVELLSRTAPKLAELLEYQGLYTDTVGPRLCLYRVSASHNPGSENLVDQPATTPLSLSLIDSQTQSALAPTPVPVDSAAKGRNWTRRSWLSYALLPLLAGAALAILSNKLRVDAPVSAAQLAVAPLQTTTPEAPASSPAPVVPREITRSAVTTSKVRAIEPAKRPVASWRGEPRAGAAPVKRLIDENVPPTSQKIATPEERLEPERTAAAEGLELTRGASLHGARAAALLLAVKPWGEVYVDGRKIGITPPLKRFDLAPGPRLITVTNGTLPRYQARFMAEPGAQLKVAHDFECISNREKVCREGFGKGLELRSSLRLETAEAGPRAERPHLDE